MKKWSKYLRHNSLETERSYRFDCQLVTAINAAYHLKGTQIKQNSDYYIHLVELAGCVAGPCIDIHKVWKELGIWENKRFMEYDLSDYLKPGCFIELCVWDKNTGNHSCAIIDYVKKADCVRIANFFEVTSNWGWMFRENLPYYLIKNVDKSKPRFNCRTFKTL